MSVMMVVVMTMIMVVVMRLILIRRAAGEDRQKRHGDDGREWMDAHGIRLRNSGGVIQTLDGCQIVLSSVKGSIVQGLWRAS